MNLDHAVGDLLGHEPRLVFSRAQVRTQLAATAIRAQNRPNLCSDFLIGARDRDGCILAHSAADFSD
jgi:hypothetical protein